MRRPKETVRVVVSIPSGAVIMDVPWWQSDTTVIRDAIAALPDFFGIKPEDCSIERLRK